MIRLCRCLIFLWRVMCFTTYHDFTSIIICYLSKRYFYNVFKKLQVTNCKVLVVVLPLHRRKSSESFRCKLFFLSLGWEAFLFSVLSRFNVCWCLQNSFRGIYRRIKKEKYQLLTYPQLCTLMTSNPFLRYRRFLFVCQNTLFLSWAVFSVVSKVLVT